MMLQVSISGQSMLTIAAVASSRSLVPSEKTDSSVVKSGLFSSLKPFV